MYTTDQYIKDTINLTKSLIIKFDDVATAIKNGLLINKQIDDGDDKRNWKYYLNISGEKHITNNDIVVFCIELNTEIILDKNVSINYPLTYDRIINNKEVYDLITNTYPDDIDYLRGMLYPVDIDVAINANDGTILNYNKTYVEHQELSLIRELTTHVEHYLNRWHVKDYIITDELYLASMLATLYGGLVNKVLNIRLSKILTSEVHTYHIEHYFRSHLDLWDDITVLTPESRIWLYNNIRYLQKHIGKENTLKVIVDKIFTANEVGIGEIVLDSLDLEINEDNYGDLSKPLYDYSEKKLISKALNDNYNNDDNINRSISSVVTAEMLNDTTIDTDIVKNDLNYYIGNVNAALDKYKLYKQQTKLLDINSYNIFKIDNDVLARVLFDNVMYYGFTTDNTNVIKFKDPNTSTYYDITPKQGSVFLLKLILDSAGLDIPISEYNCFSLLDDTLTYDQLNANTLSPTDNEYILNLLLDNVPTYPDLGSGVTTFRDYVESVLDYYTKCNIITSNLNNTTLITTTKVANEQIIKRVKIDLTSNGVAKTPTELLDDDNIVFDTNGNYNYKSSIRELILTITGVDIDQYSAIEDFINSFISILNKLTSYTTQVTRNIEDSEPLTTQYNHLNINNTSVGIVTLLEGEIVHALEPEFVWTKQYANDFIDSLNTFILENDVNMTTSINCGEGIAYTTDTLKDINAVVTTPNMTVELLCGFIDYYRPGMSISDYGQNTNDATLLDLGDNSSSRTTNNDIINVTYIDGVTSQEMTISTEPNMIIDIEEQ